MMRRSLMETLLSLAKKVMITLDQVQIVTMNMLKTMRCVAISQILASTKNFQKKKNRKLTRKPRIQDLIQLMVKIALPYCLG